MSETLRPAGSDPDLPTGISAAAERSGVVRDEHAVLPKTDELSLTERQQLADQFWLDSLLTQVLNPEDSGHREQLIGRVMQSIHAEHNSPALPLKSRRVWWASLATLAAAIMLGLLFLSPEVGSKTALAAVERSLQAAAQDVDRRYAIFVTQSTATAPNEKNFAPEAHKFATDPSPITLTVRGARRFLWEQRVALGTMRVGSNGEEYWMVPSVGPVMVAAEGSLIERLLSEKQLSTPILTMTTALEWLRDRYELENLPDEDLMSPENAGIRVHCEHIRGRLRNTEEILKPDKIEFWSDRDTGVVHRLKAHWPNNAKFKWRQVDVRLQPTPGDLPADWYDHARHHAANRVVIRRPISSGDSQDESPP